MLSGLFRTSTHNLTVDRAMAALPGALSQGLSTEQLSRWFRCRVGVAAE